MDYERILQSKEYIALEKKYNSVSHTKSVLLKLLIVSVCLLLVLLLSLHLQAQKVKSLEDLLSQYHVDAITQDVIIYNYITEDIDETAIWERGYEYGYDEAYNEVHNYYADYIGTEEFFNDYGFDF